MIRLSLRSMLSRKLRTALTVLAVFLGVTMISGTFVLTDQISNGFDDIYQQAYTMVDVVITPKMEFQSAQSGYGPVGYLPESLVDQVRGVDGVAAADGYLYGLGSVLVNGKPVTTGGAPTIVYSFTPELAQFEPDKYVDGAPPSAHGEVGIIKQLAEAKKLHVGDTIGLTTESGTEQVKVSGIFTFAGMASVGGATVVHTTPADAQLWFDAPGQVSQIYVRADQGVSADELKSRLASVIPADAMVKTGRETADETIKQLDSSFISPMRWALLIFGAVAIVVGAFIIFNTFSITVVQRLREFALVRTLGGSRRQVLSSVVGEALVMGLVASVAGLFAGVGAAKAINVVFKAFGADIPTAGIGLQARTVLVSLGVGVGITVVAALLPAFRATRVPPIAALREGAQLAPPRPGRIAPYVAAVVTLVGVSLLLVGVLAEASTLSRVVYALLGVVLVVVAAASLSSWYPRYLPYIAAAVAVLGAAQVLTGALMGGSASVRVTYMAAGILLVVGAAALASRFIVPPMVRVVGWSPTLVPLVDVAVLVVLVAVVGLAVGLARVLLSLTEAPASSTAAVTVVLSVLGLGLVLAYLGVVLGRLLGRAPRRQAMSDARLASENSVRNPSRTAATAAAMMIGLAVVVFVTVFAESLKATFIDSFNESVKGTFVVTDARNQGPAALPGGAYDAARAVPGVRDASGIAFQPVQVNGADQSPLYAITPAAIGSAWRFHWLKGGNDSLIGRLSGDNALVEEQTALKFGLEPGDTFEILTQQGEKATVKVIGEYRDPMMMNGLLVSDARFAGLFEGTLRNPWFILVATDEGADLGQVHSGLDAALKPFPNVKAYTKAEYVDQVSTAVNRFLMLFYALLAMSVIISLFGIVNTLVLAVYERTREIGMLRAIGTGRAQMRRVVRYESVITAVIGAVLGMVLGVAFGYVVVIVLASQGIGFALPVTQLVAMLIVAVIAGVAAAVIPARRAARLNILEAIHYE